MNKKIIIGICISVGLLIIGCSEQTQEVVVADKETTTTTITTTTETEFTKAKVTDADVIETAVTETAVTETAVTQTVITETTGTETVVTESTTAETETSEAPTPNAVDFVADPDAFIPEGWEVISSERGRLNDDDIYDLVRILEKKAPDSDSEDIRKLQIIYRVEENKYILALETDTATLIRVDGGVWGDPLEALSVSNNAFEISFFGGSNHKWYGTYTFCFKDEQLVLTELIQGDYFSIDLTQQHKITYNLSTGDYIIELPNKNGDMIPYKGNSLQLSPIPLEQFNIYTTMSDTNTFIETLTPQYGLNDLTALDLKSFLQLDEILDAIPYTTVKNGTFYRPLTVNEANILSLDYDSIVEKNGIQYVAYDWIEGNDNKDETYSQMTVDHYAKRLGLRVASIEELNILLADSYDYIAYDDECYYNWPMIYWTRDKGGDYDGANNPMLYDVANYLAQEPEGWDFPPFDLPVILIEGECYHPDYTVNLESVSQIDSNTDGTGSITAYCYNKDLQKEEKITLKFNGDTLFYDKNGELSTSNIIKPSQLSMDILMTEDQSFIKEVHVLPFSM